VPRRYLTPFAFLALLPLGGWLGGGWTFMAAAATPLCLAGLDMALGEEALPRLQANGRACRWIVRAYVVLQLCATGWAAALFARPGTTLLEAGGLILSAGVTTGVFGFVAAHEMVHSESPRDRALGLTFLASVFYMHFRIAHVHGHHRRAATFDDPASARLGESLYAFLVRSIAGQLGEAWAFEQQRRRNAARPVIGPGNRMLAYVTIEAALLLGLAPVSARAALFLLATALIAVLLLESFNYVAHYGLSREAGGDGRIERLSPRHSWNSARRMNNAALFNMGRHSDHHRRTTRPYQQLQPLAGAAELPSGYAAALLTALVPPLWRRTMDPRAQAARLRPCP
jgi:alkane 1-monooxygenase